MVSNGSFYLFIHSFIHSYIHSFIHSLIHSIIHHPIIHSIVLLLFSQNMRIAQNGATRPRSFSSVTLSCIFPRFLFLGRHVESFKIIISIFSRQHMAQFPLFRCHVHPRRLSLFIENIKMSFNGVAILFSFNLATSI